MVLDERLDTRRIGQLRTEAQELEARLRERGRTLFDRVKRTLNNRQLKLYSDKIAVPIEDAVAMTAPVSTLAETGAWEYTTQIIVNTDNGIDTHCRRYDAEYKVPYCFIVDTSRGTSGGYTLNVTRSQGVRDQRVDLIVLEGGQLHVGYKIIVRICSESFWGAPGRWWADFTLYGRSVG